MGTAQYFASSQAAPRRKLGTDRDTRRSRVLTADEDTLIPIGRDSMHRSTLGWTARRVGALALTLAALPAAAQAATAPAVTTGGTSNLGQQNVTLAGVVDPNG